MSDKNSELIGIKLQRRDWLFIAKILEAANSCDLVKEQIADYIVDTGDDVTRENILHELDTECVMLTNTLYVKLRECVLQDKV